MGASLAPKVYYLMSFKILSIGDPEWVRLINTLPIDRRDIHFDQRLLAPYCAAYGWKAGLAYQQEGDDFIIQPILIDDKGLLRHAYNFGGPIANSVHRNELIYEFNTSVSLLAPKQYCSLNPFMWEYQKFLLKGRPEEPKLIKEAVYIDLNNIKPRGTTRRLANKAQAAGVIVVEAGLDSLPIFTKMYNEATKYLSMKEHWHFPEAFFNALYRIPKAKLMVASLNGEPKASCIILAGHPYETAYYHFAASTDRTSLGVSHLMVLAAAEYCKSLGHKRLFLGGGITNDPKDSLLTFKSGFSKLRLPVYSYCVDYTKLLDTTAGYA